MNTEISEFPFLGEVNVLGYTVEEVRKLIGKEITGNYFKDEANLFVTVKLAGIRYTTLGEIGSGSQVIYKDQVTIMEAIANAGGIRDLGDRTKVRIIRQTPAGEKIHTIDLTPGCTRGSPFRSASGQPWPASTAMRTASASAASFSPRFP